MNYYYFGKELHDIVFVHNSLWWNIYYSLGPKSDVFEKMFVVMFSCVVVHWNTPAKDRLVSTGVVIPHYYSASKIFISVSV